MEFIRKHIEDISRISDSDWAYFSSRLVERQLKKRTVFLKRKQIEDHISFIANVVVRLYLPKELKEKEVTFGFSFKNQFISAYDSFLTRRPSLYELETLSDTKLYSISYNDLQDVYKNTEFGNLIGRLTAERLFMLKSRRQQSLLNETAEERYFNQ